MEKQKAISLFIVICIIIFMGVSAALLILSFADNKDLVVNANTAFKSEPLAIKPAEDNPIIPPPAVIEEPEEVPPPPAMVTEEQQAEKKPEETLYQQDNLQEPTRTVVSKHDVLKGDTVSGITLKYWGNAYLWPDLYTHNVWRTSDPDLIYPGEVVDILNKLGRRHQFNTEEIASITKSYLTVYELYKKQGKKSDASKWYTLYSATKIIPTFLEDNASQIDAYDIQMAKKHIEESKAFK